MVCTIAEISSRVILSGVEDDSALNAVPMGVSLSMPLLAGEGNSLAGILNGIFTCKQFPLLVGD